MLHFQGVRFKDDILEVIADRWKQQGIPPPSEEVALAYSITKNAADPLRKLIADLYVWGGVNCVVDVVNLEFQRDLNSSLIASHARMNSYFHQVRSILEAKDKPGVDEPSARRCRRGEQSRVETFEHERDMIREVAEIEWSSAPYDNDMTQLYEANNHYETFNMALKDICVDCDGKF
ncbi:hypothetical protein AOQ84DRAFT_224619 [Glonium stellatum]|uniref:Uncharacterized protein n=1 Tax=Glonium stellatum TaxID=574774 RepID=A0A8E2JQI7_9PEZI|nr:hypothetical protein AOQ84DRAFT_224619 [Glonium stellatum]